MSDEVVDSMGRVWRLTRDFGETEAAYAARLDGFRKAVQKHMTLDERIRRLEKTDTREMPSGNE